MGERTVTLTIDIEEGKFKSLMEWSSLCNATFIESKPAKRDGVVKITVSFDDYNHYYESNQHLKLLLE